MKRPLLAAILALSTSGAAMAGSSVPASGQLAFDVYRQGQDIGDYLIQFSGQGSALTVVSKTDVKVKMPLVGIVAYQFLQTSREDWKGGKLAGLSSVTDDNGTPHKVELGGSALQPASLWNFEMTRSTSLLNTIDGKTMAVKVVNDGTESVATARGKVTATHYSLSGDLSRELWYDANGVLVHVAFTGNDGSRIDYVMR